MLSLLEGSNPSLSANRPVLHVLWPDGVGLLITAGYRLSSAGLDAEEVGSLFGYVAPP